MSLFRWFVLRQLRRDLPGSGVTVAGIAVGIAVVIAIRLANASSVLGFETALDAMSGRTSLEVVGAGIGVSEDRLTELGWLRDYGLVSPVIDGDVLLHPAGAGSDDVELVRVLGVDILRDRPFREYPLREGDRQQPITTQEFLSLLTDPQAVVLTQVFADSPSTRGGQHSRSDCRRPAHRTRREGLVGERRAGARPGRQLRPDGHRSCPVGSRQTGAGRFASTYG